MVGAPPDAQRVKLRIEDYVLLTEAGAFDACGKVELIDGGVVAMNAPWRGHSDTKNELGFRLRLALAALGSPLRAMIEPTLSLPPHDMPEPDIMIADPADVAFDGYYGRDNVRIAIEVAATSLARDLGQKQHLYATHGVPEYWVVDIAKARLHQFWGPDEHCYTDHRTVPLDGEQRAITLPDLVIDGAGLF